MATTSATRQLAAVTGASSGIGRELARQFALHGFDLIVAAEDEGIHSLESELAPTGVSVRALRVDLTDEASVVALHGAIRASGRPLDAIAIHAGVGLGGAFATETVLEEELRLIQLNVSSTVHLAKLVIGDMVKQGHGRVLFTSSIAALMPTPFEAVYGASKAFVLSFAASLSNELKESGVTVTALMPGPTDTNFFHRAHMDDTQVGDEGKRENDPAYVAFLGFQALMAGEERVVAAARSTRLSAALARFVPESWKAEQHRKVAEPGSAHKAD